MHMRKRTHTLCVTQKLSSPLLPHLKARAADGAIGPEGVRGGGDVDAEARRHAEVAIAACTLCEWRVSEAGRKVRETKR